MTVWLSFMSIGFLFEGCLNLFNFQVFLPPDHDVQFCCCWSDNVG